MLSASEKKAVGQSKLMHDTRLTICSVCGEIYDGASEIERRHHASISHDPLLPQARFTAR